MLKKVDTEVLAKLVNPRKVGKHEDLFKPDALDRGVQVWKWRRQTKSQVRRNHESLANPRWDSESGLNTAVYIRIPLSRPAG